MKKIWMWLLLFAASSTTFGQDFGLSFSYFIPKNGSFSTPVSPFSIRGIGVDLGEYLSLETGATLYRMSGLNIKDLPFESSQPMAGPNLTLFIPGEVVFRLKGKSAEINFNGGGFAYYGFFQKLNEGNIDRAIREYEDWSLANSDLTQESKPGLGYKFGSEIIFDVTRQWGISLQVNYLSGYSALPLTGSYSGLNANQELIKKEVNYKDAKLDLTGLEFSLSILLLGRK